jgi:hypothetical protein
VRVSRGLSTDTHAGTHPALIEGRVSARGPELPLELDDAAPRTSVLRAEGRNVLLRGVVIAECASPEVASRIAFTLRALEGIVSSGRHVPGVPEERGAVRRTLERGDRIAALVSKLFEEDEKAPLSAVREALSAWWENRELSEARPARPASRGSRRKARDEDEPEGEGEAA